MRAVNLYLFIMIIHFYISGWNMFFWISAHSDNHTSKGEKDVKKLIECYAHRWKIERFHYILKSGCKIEKNQAG